MKVTWENVFNSNHKKGWKLSLVQSTAKTSGYPYFTWNEQIYDTLTYGNTGLTVKDLK